MHREAQESAQDRTASTRYELQVKGLVTPCEHRKLLSVLPATCRLEARVGWLAEHQEELTWTAPGHHSEQVTCISFAFPLQPLSPHFTEE